MNACVPAPDGLTPGALTSIYGEEDWNEAKTEGDADADADADAALEARGQVVIDRDRLQSV